MKYKDKMKCFFGIILNLDNFNFFAPFTSYKKKFKTMKNDLDFYKIVDSKSGKIYGAINLNNMIPVFPNDFREVSFDNLESFRYFDNLREKKLYWKLLSKELGLINERLLIDNAEIIYILKDLAPENNISRRCCDFSLLKEKCKDYCSK